MHWMLMGRYVCETLTSLEAVSYIGVYTCSHLSCCVSTQMWSFESIMVLLTILFHCARCTCCV